MIIRLVVVDPTPRPTAKSDLLVYQVPENSREHEFLVLAMNHMHAECVEISGPKLPKKGKVKE